MVLSLLSSASGACKTGGSFMKRSIVGAAAFVLLFGGVEWAKAGAYIALNFPGAPSTAALGISGNNVVGYYNDGGSVTLGFLFDGKSYKTIDPNGFTYTFATGVSGKNIIGLYADVVAGHAVACNGRSLQR